MSHGQAWSQARCVAQGDQCVSTPQVLGFTGVPHYTWFMVLVELEMKPWSLYVCTRLHRTTSATQASHFRVN